jgi:hypothetical protein
MATNKTVPTELSVRNFIDSIEDQTRRSESLELSKLLAKATGKKPKMWGSAIIGFGSHHYHYESGREGDQPIVSFSPRKAGLSIYGISGALKELKLSPDKLGKVTTSGGCVQVKKLENIDLRLLEKLAIKAFAISSKTAK